jgi:predicted amidohydrolase YtcJ
VGLPNSPHRARDLDAVTGDHPAYLERTDGHIAVVNTAALRAAGITGNPAPQGGQIDLDATRQPHRHPPRRRRPRPRHSPNIPKPDAATRRRALQLAIDDALAHGVTSVQDFSDWDDFLVLEQMEHDHAPPPRLRVAHLQRPLAVLKAARASPPLNDPLLHTGMLKGFMDGSLGSRTAALAAPYSDDPTNSGIPRYDQAKLNQMATERAAAGFQLGFHAIGDEANTMALNAFLRRRETEVEVCRTQAKPVRSP